MLAYNKLKFENTLLFQEAVRLFKMKFISREQLAKISDELPRLNSNHFLIRIGFFLLGCILFSSIMGSLGLIFQSVLLYSVEFFLYFFTAIAIFGSELLVRKDYYRHGLDDAFVIIAQLSFAIAVGISTGSPLWAFAALFLIGFLSCLRYVNSFAALACCFGLTGFLVCLITEHQVINKLFLPFVGFVLALLLYGICYRLRVSRLIYRYSHAMNLAQIFSLVLGYVSVNYMVVREVSVNFLGLYVEEGKDIVWAPLFYILTFALPIFYICYSLYSKDRIMLIVGLLALGYSFVTIRFYYSLMPLELALLLGGVVLFGISFLAIRKLQKKTSGITFAPDRDSDNVLLSNAQALLVATHVSTDVMTKTDSPMTYGGGDFSGGGASGSF